MYYALIDVIKCLTLRYDGDEREPVVVGEPEIVLSGLSSVKSIAIDWVNDRLYYGQEQQLLDQSGGQVRIENVKLCCTCTAN